MHLVDHARAYIEERYTAPVERAAVPQHPRLRRCRYPAALPRRASGLRVSAGRSGAAREGERAESDGGHAGAGAARIPPAAQRRPAPSCRRPKGRIALLQGCAEPVLRPEFRAATVRLLNRAGYDVVFAPGEACCGAAGPPSRFRGSQRSTRHGAMSMRGWREIERSGLLAIVMTASGCGTTIKDYGFMLRDDPALRRSRRRASAALAKDISELLAVDRSAAGRRRGAVRRLSRRLLAPARTEGHRRAEAAS